MPYSLKLRNLLALCSCMLITVRWIDLQQHGETSQNHMRLDDTDVWFPFFSTCNLIMPSAASPWAWSACFCFQLYDSSPVNNFISVVPPENLAHWNWCVGRVVDGFMHVALLQVLGEYSVTFLHLHLFLSFLGFVVVICPSLTCSFLCLV